MRATITEKGPIAWMAKNHVAANLLMLVFLVGGALFVDNVKQEVFPEVELDIIQVSVPYPSASPAEVEQGILLSIEEEVRGLDGVKEVRSTALEGAGIVNIELLTSAEPNKLLQDVKNQIDSIQSFPQDAERPIVRLLTNRFRVISLVLSGEVPEASLRKLGNQVRDKLLLQDNITYVELSGVRDLEITVEVPKKNLREYNLRLEDVAREIRQTAVEIPAGGVKTDSGEVLLRTAERRNFGIEFENIPIKSLPDGTQVELEDIATITDGFRESDVAFSFNGKPAVMVDVYRVGDEKPIEISGIVKEFAKTLEKEMPEGIEVGYWFDASEMYNDRIDLLIRNASIGLVLVLLILGLFLEIRLAFWVTLGIPISVLGSIMLLPSLDVSINMISLFAFIVTLGIIVDDAIVVGENIFELRRQGMTPLAAAVKGASTIAMPVTFSILTNIVAFAPLLFIPGVSGKFWRVIPIVVISVFIISWIESLFILPSHLASTGLPKKKGLLAVIEQQQQKFSRLLDHVIMWIYKPFVEFAIRNRYATLATGLSIVAITAGLVLGGVVKFTFFPKVDSDSVTVDAVLPFGSPIQETQNINKHLLASANKLIEEFGGKEMTKGVLAATGLNFANVDIVGGGGGSASNSHLCSVVVYFIPSGERGFTAQQFANAWRKEVGNMSNIESLIFKYTGGPQTGKPIDLELSHNNLEVLNRAGQDLAAMLGRYAGVEDIDDGFKEGKPQFDMQLKEEARSLGITASELASQTRSAFYGARAFRQQRGRDEVWVMVKLPEEERRSEHDIEDLLIRTPDGKEIPLPEAAVITRGRAYTEISRNDGKRVIDVTADVDNRIANSEEILVSLEEKELPELLAKYPGLGIAYEGQFQERQETNESMMQGFLFVLLIIYAILAIPFKSYIQPIVVMSAIPFGFAGAVWGHILMGYDLSLISVMGLVALSGVIINDSLVMVVAANEARNEGMSVFDSIIKASTRRFRPIILTSVTTFGGLAPMIFETSMQARFLIPMALSLGFGILFGTLIILFIVPSLYVIVDDFAWLVKTVFGFVFNLYSSKSESKVKAL